MNAIDDSQTYENVSDEQSPSLLVIILDTNPIAWSLLSSQLTLSAAVSALLVFINAHLACAYTNKVAVIASHCSTAKYLYPSNAEQYGPNPNHKSHKRAAADEHQDDENGLAAPAANLTINGSTNTTPKKLKLNMRPPQPNGQPPTNPSSAKYRAFRLIEEEFLANLTTLLNSTQPSDISTSTTSTLTAGALTLALSHINLQKTAYAESTGRSTTIDLSASTSSSRRTNTGLQSRILLLSTSPSTDLAHQYIPIMNAIFACQRLSIPIDILSIPLPSQPATSTVFLQQAADATSGIYIPVRLASEGPAGSTSSTNEAILTNTHTLLLYLLQSFLPSPAPGSRAHLNPPTLTNVDFRAACFCHRTVIDTGYVCSICLSIFCEAPQDGVCLTCGTELVVGDFGARPVVVNRNLKKKGRRKGGDGGGEGGGMRGGGSGRESGVGTPMPG